MKILSEKHSVLKKNVISNFVGTFFISLGNILILPLYVKLLGPHSYGLVGFYTTLNSVFAILDLGLTSTLSRELAKLSVLENSALRIRNKVKTLERIYFIISIFIVLLVFSLAPLLSSYVQSDIFLDKQTIQKSILLMGIVIAFRWPSSMYIGGLFGLQKQVLYNSVNIAFEVIKMGGTVLCLMLIKADIMTFFYYQVCYYFFYSIAFGIILWKVLPKAAEKARFVKKEFSEMWKFASGMTGISILSVILTQVDKIILLRMLTLDKFGYYSLASSVASSLYRVIGPIDQSFYPKIVQLVTLNSVDEIREIYHKACQFMAVSIIPVASFICFFSNDLVFLWTHDHTITNNVAPLVSLIIVGTTLHGLVFIPYAFQLAYGWTKFAIYQNIASIIVLAPLLYFFSRAYGASGAAIIWIILNLGYILICQPLMHRRILTKELSQWYKEDILIPSVSAISVVLLLKLVVDNLDLPPLFRYSVLGFILLITYIVTAISTHATRKYVFQYLRFIKR